MTIQEEWGLKCKAYSLLHKWLYIPAITYSTVAWFDRVSHSHVDRILNAIQRKLLYMTRACRTTSTAAMQVISSWMPMKLKVIRRALLVKVRRMEPVAWSTYRFVLEETQSEGWLRQEKEKLETVLYNQWQQEWDENEHGRMTYRFIPNFRFFRENWKWFRPNRSCVYIITGYESINKSCLKETAYNQRIAPDAPMRKRVWNTCCSTALYTTTLEEAACMTWR